MSFSGFKSVFLIWIYHIFLISVKKQSISIKRVIYVGGKNGCKKSNNIVGCDWNDIFWNKIIWNWSFHGIPWISYQLLWMFSKINSTYSIFGMKQKNKSFVRVIPFIHDSKPPWMNGMCEIFIPFIISVFIPFLTSFQIFLFNKKPFLLFLTFLLGKTSCTRSSLVVSTKWKVTFLVQIRYWFFSNAKLLDLCAYS